MNSRDQRGFLAPFVLVLLYSLSCQIITLSILEQRWLAFLKQVKDRAAGEEILWDQASSFINTFLIEGGDRPTPQSLENLPGYSHRVGSLFYYAPLPEITLSLEELSSRINPKRDSLEYWQVPPLANRISSTGALLRWDNERHNAGAIETPEELEWLFPKEDWEDLYSLYTIPPDQGHGGWNLHFMSSLMKEAVARYPWGGEGFKNPNLVFRRLSELCQNGPITREAIEDVLREENIKPRNELTSWLGERSWFWRIRIVSGAAGLDLIIRFFDLEVTAISRDVVRDQETQGRGFQLVSWIKTGGEL